MLADNGVATVDLDPVALIDQLLGNRDGSTALIDLDRVAAQLRALLGPDVETRAALYADLAWPAGAIGTVWGDATSAYLGVYKKAGASGAGSWTRIGDTPQGLVRDRASHTGTQAISTIDGLQTALDSAGAVPTRPGEQPGAYGAGLYGAPETLVDFGSVPGIAIATVAAAGRVLRIDDVAIVVAPRIPQAVVPGRVYQANAYVRRDRNPADPSGASVAFAIAPMTATYAALGAPVAVEVGVLRLADGLRHYRATFAIDPGLAEVDQLINPASVYVRVLVETYGTDHGTTLEGMWIDDITGIAQIDGALDVLAVTEAREDAQAAAAAAALDRAETALNRAAAETFGKRSFDTYAEMIADTTLTPANTSAGDTIDVRMAGNFRVVTSGQFLTTPGLLKLRPMEGYGGFAFTAFGMDVSNPLQDHTNLLLNAMTAGNIINFPPLPINVETAIDLRADYGVGIWGSGKNPFGNRGTLFIHRGDNEALFRVLGPAVLKEFAFTYDAPQDATKTNSIGIEIQRVSEGKFSQLWGSNCHITFGQKQAGYGDDDFNTMYSTCFEECRSTGASHTHFDFRNHLGGGTHNRFHNLYANGGGTWRFADVVVPIMLTPTTPFEFGFRWLNQSGMAVGEVSVEGAKIGEQAYEFGNCNGSATSIRTEVVQLEKNASGLVKFTEGYNNMTVQNVIVQSLMAGQVNPGTGAVDAPVADAFLLEVNSPIGNVDIKSLSLDRVTITTTSGRLGQTLYVGAGVELGSVVQIGKISRDGVSTGIETTTWSEGKRSHPPIVEKFNDGLVFTRRRAGRGNLYSTVLYRVSGPPLLSNELPEQGAFAYGDVCEYISPGAIGRVVADMWVPPGVWSPIGLVGGESTIQTITSDADFTLQKRVDRSVIRLTGNLTRNVVITLSDVGAYNGADFQIIRTGGNVGGPWTVSVGGLKLLAQGQKATVGFEFGWLLTGFETL